jgi:chromosomal replication initiator protein
LAAHLNLDQTWAQIQSRLRRTFPDSTYQIWLSELEPVALDRNVLYLKSPRETRDWLCRRYGSRLSSAAAETDSSIERVELLEEKPSAADSSAADSTPVQRSASVPLKPTYSFDRFVIGTGNRFAHGAALAVAELPGQAYNPLFIHGPSGVGKTHLLQAIGNYITVHDTTVSVRYATTESFTSDFLSALQRDDIDAFKKTYRSPDVLLVDDIHFLEHKAKTSEEFFYTFDALLSRGTQIVLASDRHPSRLQSLEAHLKERFQAGLIADLSPPDLQARLAILQKLAGHSQREVAGDVLAHIAHQLPPNVRVLEGALIRVIAFASLTNNDIDVALSDQVLASLYQQTSASNQEHVSSRKRIATIQEQTAAALGLDQRDLCSSRRSRQVVYARQIAMYLSRELTGDSYPSIAEQFGGRDHTTVLHAHRRVKAQLLTDASIRSLITKITQALNP